MCNNVYSYSSVMDSWCICILRHMNGILFVENVKL